MKVFVRAVAIAVVLALSLGFATTVFAAKPDKAEGRKGKAVAGIVISTDSSSFVLDTKRKNDDNVTVKVSDGTAFAIPGGKKLRAIVSGWTADKLSAGDKVVVRGRWEESEFQAKTIRLTGKTIKRFTGVADVSGGSVKVTKGDGREMTFSTIGAVVLPSGSTVADGDKVKVIYRKGTTNALGIVVKKSAT